MTEIRFNIKEGFEKKLDMLTKYYRHDSRPELIKSLVNAEFMKISNFPAGFSICEKCGWNHLVHSGENNFTCRRCHHKMKIPLYKDKNLESELDPK